MAIAQLASHDRLSSRRKPAKAPASGALKCRRKFLRHFPGGFRDETYLEWERNYKWAAHERWDAMLGGDELRALMDAGEYAEIGRRATSIESRTNLLFSFEKMALRDAVKPPAGARAFAEGLWAFLHGRGSEEGRFNAWVECLAVLPRRQTRVLTWPVATVVGFIAQPDRHIFLKPNVTRVAAAAYGFPFEYASRPNWATYQSLIAFAEQVRRDQKELRPRDMIDLQGFIWVMGSDEY